MTWTHPATPIALTPLTVTFWNVNARDNLIHLRGMLPDPTAAGRLLRSTGAETAGWVAAGTAVLDALGYTPANKAGDTFSGPVNITSTSPNSFVTLGGVSANGNIVSAAGVVGATGSFGTVTATSYGAVAGTTANFTGALSAASLSSAGAIAATTGVSGASVSATGAVAAGTNVTAGGDVTAVANVQGNRLISTVPTGTAPLQVNSTTQVANLHAARAALADNASNLGGRPDTDYPLYASGTYTGNGAGSRQITVGFRPAFVWISRPSSPIFWLVDQGVAIRGLTSAPPSGVELGPDSNVSIHASDGFVVSTTNASNTNGDAYRYVAFG